MKSKYIIIKRDGIEVPLVFPRCLLHEDMGLAQQNNILSAGFCELDAERKWKTTGESISLKLHSRPQDAEILKMQF